jgi:hypothetical protein
MLKDSINNVTELCKERDRLKLLASREIEVAAAMFFGFMICEAKDGKAEVRIKFADLTHAQRLHRALVMIQHDKAKEVGGE